MYSSILALQQLLMRATLETTMEISMDLVMEGWSNLTLLQPCFGSSLEPLSLHVSGGLLHFKLQKSSREITSRSKSLGSDDMCAPRNWDLIGPDQGSAAFVILPLR